MLLVIEDSIFDSCADSYIVPVGLYGFGDRLDGPIAKEFVREYPFIKDEYADIQKRGMLKIGESWILFDQNYNKNIVIFPVREIDNNSRNDLAAIERGLDLIKKFQPAIGSMAFALYDSEFNKVEQNLIIKMIREKLDSDSKVIEIYIKGEFE